MKLITAISIILFIYFPLLANESGKEVSSVSKMETGDIVVEVSDFDSDSGIAILHLHDDASNFPTESSHSFMRITGKPENKKGTFVFKDVPYGFYAFTIHHDENDNGEMDTNFLGLPKEGYGFSNDLHPLTSPPGFEEAKFFHNNSESRLKVRMN